MNAALPAIALVGGFVGFALLARRQAQLELDDARDEGEAAEPPRITWGAVDLWGMTEEAIEGNTVLNAINADDVGALNLAAFLTMIGDAEGTNSRADPYRVCYAYRHTIADLSDHPAVTGEWKGEPLDNLGPRYAGKVSTAAGRYQIIRPTWLRAKRALGLVDFGPAAQDAAAAWLIQQRGALDDVLAGNLPRAVLASSAEWASLPGSTAGQGKRSPEWLQARYEAAGGLVA